MTSPADPADRGFGDSTRSAPRPDRDGSASSVKGGGSADNARVFHFLFECHGDENATADTAQTCRVRCHGTRPGVARTSLSTVLQNGVRQPLDSCLCPQPVGSFPRGGTRTNVVAVRAAITPGSRAG